MNNVINKIGNWFLKSSNNPDQVSMTVEGIALLAGSHAIDNLSAVGINLSQTAYAHDVAIAATVFGVVLTVVGAARKIVLSVQNGLTPIGTVNRSATVQ